MINIDNIIDFYEAIDEHLNEIQIYKLIQYIYKNSHDFKNQITKFYCNILKKDYFNIADYLTEINHGNEEDLKKFAHDIYQYCTLKFD